MSLDGKVAWVAGLGSGDEADPIGRAVALALSARGVRVLVSGPVEKALGVVVGEIAHGGGKARHVVTPAHGDRAAADATVARAMEAFGRVDFVITCCDAGAPASPDASRVGPLGCLFDAFCTFAAAHAVLHEGGRLLAVAAPEDAPGDAIAFAAARAGLEGLVRATSRAAVMPGVTCNALLPASVDAPPEDVAELVVFLCGSGGATLTGQSLTVGVRPRPARAG